ncbi:MAG: 30S ribosomal protein S24e [Nanoarchaeota archaeon]
MNILQNKENKLLKRKEIIATLENKSSTPARKEIREMLAKKLKVDKDLVVVNSIIHKFGSSDIDIKAKVYDTKESLELNARSHMKKRNTDSSNKEEQEV